MEETWCGVALVDTFEWNKNNKCTLKWIYWGTRNAEQSRRASYLIRWFVCRRKRTRLCAHNQRRRRRIWHHIYTYVKDVTSHSISISIHPGEERREYYFVQFVDDTLKAFQCFRPKLFIPPTTTPPIVGRRINAVLKPVGPRAQKRGFFGIKLPDLFR